MLIYGIIIEPVNRLLIRNIGKRFTKHIIYTQFVQLKLVFEKDSVFAWLILKG